LEPVLGQAESLPRGNLNVIQTVLFTDGLKRAVQTKKDAAVSPQAGTGRGCRTP
jgi:hypothetical protein